jgi:hypothetical protein
MKRQGVFNIRIEKLFGGRIAAVHVLRDAAVIWEDPEPMRTLSKELAEAADRLEEAKARG